MATANLAARGAAAPLIIFGASCRAAAFSALRAGFAPVACDRFGDADLRAHAAHVALPRGRRRDIAGSLRRTLECLPPAPWLYAGSFENRPQVVDEIAGLRPLWGIGGAALRAVRDPFLLGEALARAGVPMPEMRPAAAPPHDPRGWLEKPMAGRGVRPAWRAPRGRGARHAGRAFYYQRLVRGLPASGLFLAGARGCRLLGATRQLVGERGLHARPFAWCGNLAPLLLEERPEAALRRAGEAAAAAFALRGLFGIDFILAPGRDGSGAGIVPLEVNPRYTAAVELLEHALDFAALALHAAAFRGVEAPAPAWPESGDGGRRHEVFGKAVLHAPAALTTRADLLALYRPDPFRFPLAADLPPPGARLARGEPVLTVFARARSEAACRAQLLARAREALRHFEAPRRPSGCRQPLPRQA